MKTCLFQVSNTKVYLLSHPRRGLVLIIMLLWSSFSSIALGQTKQWDKTIGGNDADVLTSLQQTSDGGYILGGSSFSNGGGEKTDGNNTNCDSCAGNYKSDYWVVKLNAAGQKQWDKTFGSNAEDELTSIQQTSDGGYILGGSSYSKFISGDKTDTNKADCSSQQCTADYWVVKLNATGQKQWDKTIGGNYIDMLTSLQQTSDGGYILGGSSWSGISGDKTEDNKGFNDYWVVKLNAAGDKEWDKTFGGNKEDELTSLQQTSDGGYILGGFSPPSAIRNFDYWVVKLNAAGDKEWDKTFGGEARDELQSLQQTSDGGYILGGSSLSGIGGDKTEDSRGYYDYWVVKLNAAGDKEWDKTFGGDSRDGLQSLKQTSDGGYILGGFSFSDISGDKTEDSRGYTDYWVLKLNAQGLKEWDKTFGGNYSDELTSLQQTSDEGYILGGASWSDLSGDKTGDDRGIADYWVVKLDNSTPCNQAVQSFTLVNAETDNDIMTLQEGDVIDLASINGKAINIRANTIPAEVGSVVFELSGMRNYKRTEIGAPYALFSDIDGDYVGDSLKVGEYTLTATPYCGARGAGPKGPPLTIHFKVTNSAVVSVYGFTLIDADNDKAIMELKESDTVNLAVLPSLKLNVRANTDPFQVGSVSFALQGPQTYHHTENHPPYALFANRGGDYFGSSLQPGNYTLTATPYSAAGGGGKKGTPLTVRFYVLYQEVNSFTLVNAETNQDITLLRSGDMLALSTLSTKLNIRANTTPETVGSVVFDLSGAQTRQHTENYTPYALFGNNNSANPAWIPQVGSYLLTATPFSGRMVSGIRGVAHTIVFSVVNSLSTFNNAAAREAQNALLAAEKRAVRLSAFPNPFTSQSTISFSVDKTGYATLEVYTTGGAEIAHIYQGQVEAGREYRTIFESTGLPVGVYILRLATRESVASYKLVLMP